MRPTDSFDRPVAFHREFVEITGSVTSALFLSQAVYWSKITGWDEFYKTQEEWEKETGMTRSEQEGARTKLKALGLLIERYDRWKHRMYYQLNRSRLDELMEARIRECGKPAVGNAENQQSYKSTETTQESTEPAAPDASLPPTIFPLELQTDDFKTAWGLWLKHLRDQRKYVGDVQRDMIFRDFIVAGAEMSTAIIHACLKTGKTQIYMDVKLPEMPHKDRAPDPYKLTPMQEALKAMGMPYDL